MTEPIVLIEVEEDEPSVIVDIDQAPSAYCPVRTRFARGTRRYRGPSEADGIPREVEDLEKEFVHAAASDQSVE